MIIKIKSVVFYTLLLLSAFHFTACKTDTAAPSEVTSGDPQIDQLTAAINKTPNDADLYYQRAQLYYNKNIYDRSIADLKYALKIDSLNPNYYHLLSDAYLDYGYTKEALDALQDVMYLYPERIPTLLKYAELKYIFEDYDGSILTLNEIVRLDAQNADAYFMLGMNFLALKDTARATNSFQTAVEMDSGLTDAWIFLGEIYEKKNDPRALKYYDSAILSDPESMQARHAKAFYLQNHGDIPGALKIYREIIEKDREYTDAILNSGLLYIELDSLDKAYEQFNVMAGIAPTNYLGFYYRGIVNEKKGNKDAALKDYESAYNLNRDDKKVEEALLSLKNH